MPSITSSLVLTIVALQGFISTTNAHGHMMKPVVVKNPQAQIIDGPSHYFDGNKVLPPLDRSSYSGTGDQNYAKFNAAFKASNFTTLRDFARFTMANGKGDAQCGVTRLADPQPLPDQVEFGFRQGEGFVADHQGPCEIWCDDNRVMTDDNCAVTFKAKSYMEGYAKLSYEKAKCSGAKVMSFYWMNVILPREWQLYINCAALVGGGASPSTDSPTSAPVSRQPAPVPTPAPAPAPAPAVTTVAPTTTRAPPASPVTTPAPSSTPSAPSTPAASKKPACRKRVRQL